MLKLVQLYRTKTIEPVPDQKLHQNRITENWNRPSLLIIQVKQILTLLIILNLFDEKKVAVVFIMKT